jgi:hypothetical protein
MLKFNKNEGPDLTLKKLRNRAKTMHYSRTHPKKAPRRFACNFISLQLPRTASIAR